MVLKVTDKLPHRVDAQATLTLPFELRQKSRLRAVLDNGSEVGLMLPRGEVLRGGDCLRAENGLVIQLKAAEEAVTSVTSSDTLLLQKACYHLGNRHVPLQITDKGICYLQDYVLDQMVKSLGLSVTHEMAPFEPESGAYHSHTNSNNHSHQHHHHEQ
ncbi:MAG: urease accessory protein UreE [Gammaproteobacteria bacterium SG8_11]|nr:MAG: urease accessory protein UreE [Gammaproteobacteria bacterium SG8_11]